jgi:hypothetical protein
VGPDIDSPGGKAWSVQKVWDGIGLPNQVPDAIAKRSLSGPLEVGQTIVVDFDSRIGLDEPAGLFLRTSAGEQRLEVFDVAAVVGVSTWQPPNKYQYVLGPSGAAEHGMHLEITLTSADTYSLAHNSFGSPLSMVSGTLSGTPGAAISEIAFYRAVFTAPDGRSVGYFNNLAVVPEPATLAGALCAMLLLRRR